MIIEDEYFTSEELKFILQRLRPNYKMAFMAEDVESSIAFLKENEVNLIFTDIKLCDGTCFDIFHEVKTDASVAFITGYKEFKKKALNYNGIDYILKPCSEKALLRALCKFEALHGITPHSDKGK